MSKELIASLFRNFLRVAIGAAVTAGYIQPGVITDQTTMEISGALAFMLLEWWSHRHKTLIKVTAAEETRTLAIEAVRNVASTEEGKTVLTDAIQTAVIKKAQDNESTKNSN